MAKRSLIGVLAGALTTIGMASAGAAVSVRDAGIRAGAGAPGTLRLGKVTVRKCGTAPLTYCGGMGVPLDYSSKASPPIHLGFEWLPATHLGRGKPARGTVLAVEGGPGFASTGSEPLFAGMLGSLRRTRNLLLIDLRGTGGSTPLNCPGLENFSQVQHQFGTAFDRLVGKCGSQLDHTWRYRHSRRFVHASDLFNTAYSARDVSRVVSALRIGRVDLYGDSYGSWFAQVFASRYPAQLRSVTLDSTFQVLGLDPWYTTTVIVARQAFEHACFESVACRSAGGHGAWDRIGKLARRLAKEPVTGVTVSPAGTRTKLTVTVQTLVNLVNNAGFDPLVYRDLDAATRALLVQGDQVPLLRLAELSLSFDDTSFPLPEFSDGLYFAVACTDYVQLFNRRASPAVKARQYRNALRREPPGTFAPFTVAQWTQLDQYTEAYNACLNWPAATRLTPPITRRPPLVPPRLHVLILSGTLDSLTPWLHGASLVGTQMGRSARLVMFSNLTHVTLQDADNACPQQIFRTFISNPAGLAHQNTSCAGRIAPVHAVGSYPLRLGQAVPAQPTTGNAVGRPALLAASTALASVGDEISRFPLLFGIGDLGLRGGQVSFSGGNVLKISLHNARWVANATVNGTANWNQATGWVTAQLTVTVTGAQPVKLTARWRTHAGQDQLAVITGSQGGRRLAAVTPAP